MAGILDILLGSSASARALKVSLADTAVDPANAEAGFTVGNDGVVTTSAALGEFDYAWLTTGNAGDYDVMVETVSGTLSTGNADTWENCGTSRSYARDRTSAGNAHFTGILKFRLAGAAGPLSEASVDLDAEVTL